MPTIVEFVCSLLGCADQIDRVQLLIARSPQTSGAKGCVSDRCMHSPAALSDDSKVIADERYTQQAMLARA
jgi:hypothetical protein